MIVEHRERNNYVAAEESKYLKWHNYYFKMAYLPLTVDLAEITEVDESEVPVREEGSEYERVDESEL